MFRQPRKTEPTSTTPTHQSRRGCMQRVYGTKEYGPGRKSDYLVSRDSPSPTWFPEFRPVRNGSGAIAAIRGPQVYHYFDPNICDVDTFAVTRGTLRRGKELCHITGMNMFYDTRHMLCTIVPQCVYDENPTLERFGLECAFLKWNFVH